MATITKKELVDRIAGSIGASRAFAKAVVQQFLDEIVTELVKGNRLEFRDFGIFEPRTHAAREAQNPKTLKKLHVPPKRTVRFKAGRLMKKKLNGQISD